ncbi:MAG: hypothetical protein ACE5LU_18730 [Anaerolineae bacterium]
MDTAIVWVPIGIITVLYILYLQIQIWWRDRVIEYVTRPPRDESERGCGGLLVAMALLLGVIYMLITAGR